MVTNINVRSWMHLLSVASDFLFRLTSGVLILSPMAVEDAVFMALCLPGLRQSLLVTMDNFILILMYFGLGSKLAISALIALCYSVKEVEISCF